ncbi:hypothetical protein BIWAKO_00219 [Bosea sp. BIWAKO-01]|nr:hypothetical protein BIWAKO_00219 [Bosea sp. BIWAKO-01]
MDEFAVFNGHKYKASFATAKLDATNDHRANPPPALHRF